MIPAEIVSGSPILQGLPDISLSLQCRALESSIRKYTNNSFRVRGSSVEGEISSDGSLIAHSWHYAPGDRAEVPSGPDKGLYWVKSVGPQRITLDRPLTAEPHRVSLWKVSYPDEVILGALKILEWSNDPKAQRSEGVDSETISRHSVKYKGDYNANGALDYPARLTGFLKQYMKARF